LDSGRAAIADWYVITPRSRSQAVAVATARSPTGRANKASLVTIGPDDLPAQVVEQFSHDTGSATHGLGPIDACHQTPTTLIHGLQHDDKTIGLNRCASAARAER